MRKDDAVLDKINLLLLGQEKIEDQIKKLSEQQKSSEKRLSARIDDVENKLISLDAKIDAVEERLTAKIDDVETKLSARIDDGEERLTTKIDQVQSDTADILSNLMQHGLDPHEERISRLERSVGTHAS
jgi:chromosome segregation ATPase